jgi:predicted transcriptional regulator YheO
MKNITELQREEFRRLVSAVWVLAEIFGYRMEYMLHEIQENDIIDTIPKEIDL